LLVRQKGVSVGLRGPAQQQNDGGYRRRKPLFSCAHSIIVDERVRWLPIIAACLPVLPANLHRRRYKSKHHLIRKLVTSTKRGCNIVVKAGSPFASCMRGGIASLINRNLPALKRAAAFVHK
jgi:hypothetical protein